MIRITRASTLADLTTAAARASTLAEQVDQAHADLGTLRALADDDAQRIGTLHTSLKELDEDHSELRKQLRAAQEQVLLDQEDRVVLRALLRAARRQEQRDRDTVYLLYRRGELHSVHRARERAETAAEKDGAVPGGWAPCPPGAQPPSDDSVPTGWRIEPVRLGATDR